MADETVKIDNLPDVNDINVLLDAITGIGADVQRVDRHTVRINGRGVRDFSIEYDYIILSWLCSNYQIPGNINIVFGF